MTGVFTLFIAYLIRHPHFPPLHRKASAPASPLWERSPTPHPLAGMKTLLRRAASSPDHYRRGYAGLVSYYALFKGMAASKPTSQLSQHTHILCYTEPPLRGLSRRSGFFPSRRGTLAHCDCLPDSIQQAFGVWLGEVSLFTTRTHPVLYLL